MAIETTLKPNKMPKSDLKQYAYNHIMEQILGGQIKVGSKISDIKLANELGMSRTPVREAILQLETEGIIKQIPRYGAFLKELSREELKELYELREMLEGPSAERAAELITERQLEQLKRLCSVPRELAKAIKQEGRDKLTEKEDSKLTMADMGFHILLMSVAGNRYVLKTIERYAVMTKIMSRKGAKPGMNELAHLAATYRDHYRVYRAIRDRDSKRAGYWMRHHIRLACEGALEKYDEDKRQGISPEYTMVPSVHQLLRDLEE